MPPEEDGEAPADPTWLVHSRTEAERDFDRILFATPTRRLGDKTQVFPLDKNESVRTRLTHSHEVSNLARSIGTHIVHSELHNRIVADAVVDGKLADEGRLKRSVPATLAAVGLAHDLGNPPFGHQGEEAIRTWIRRNEQQIFTPASGGEPYENGAEMVQPDLRRITPAQKQDFLQFEGNAQTLRTVSRLQVVKDARGLNLTFGTLAALMKYTVGSERVLGKEGPAARKKIGFFCSEHELVRRIHSETGLSEGCRHPLTYIMEACDDIAYSIIDAEDAVKKQIVSFPDLMFWIKNRPEYKKESEGDLIKWVVAKSEHESIKARESRLSPSEWNDVSVQLFRSYAIGAAVSAVIDAFSSKYDELITGGLKDPLLTNSRAENFCELLKDFDKIHAYRYRGVLEIELGGFNVINDLMDLFWEGIIRRQNFSDVCSPRSTPFARYAYGRISENYRRIFEERLPVPCYDRTSLPIRYRELQLLTDMIAGMTDQFALDLRQELKGFHVGASASAAAP
jgi:dGTPase